jgi:hypothetical protein
MRIDALIPGTKQHGSDEPAPHMALASKDEGVVVHIQRRLGITNEYTSAQPFTIRGRSNFVSRQFIARVVRGQRVLKPYHVVRAFEIEGPLLFKTDDVIGRTQQRGKLARDRSVVSDTREGPHHWRAVALRHGDTYHT